MDNRFSNVHASGIHMGGWDDPFSEGTIRGFMGYNCEGASEAQNHQILLMAGMGHGLVVGEIAWSHAWQIPVYDLESFLFNTELLKVNGERGSQSYEDAWAARPKAYYYVYSDPDYDGIDPKACSWRIEYDWPPSSTPERWYLHPGVDQWNGMLTLEIPTEYNELSYEYDPSDPCPTNGGNNLYWFSHDDFSLIGQGSTDQRGLGSSGAPGITSRDDVISFVSENFSSPYEFIGNIKAKLYVKSNASDTDFVGKLIDVFPDGREMLITDGIIRACRMNGFNTTTWMSPETVYELNVDLWSKAWRFQPNHKLKLLVTSSNYPRFQRNPNLQEEIIPTTLIDWNNANNTIIMAPEYPSYLELPITDGVLGDLEPDIWVTSPYPPPSNETTYNIKWESQHIDSVDLTLNGITIATGLDANNTELGYDVSDLIPNFNNTIEVVGKSMGKSDVADFVIVRPYCDPPHISLINPEPEELFDTSDVLVNWTINSVDSAGVSKIWIESDSMAQIEIDPTISEYLLGDLSYGAHWVKITAKGVNGMYSSVNNSFHVEKYKPTLTITSPPFGCSDQLSYTLSWTNSYCFQFHVYLNGELIGGPYNNNTQTIQINNLLPNLDNNITLVGTSIYNTNVTTKVQCHPYTGDPTIQIISPKQGTTINSSHIELLWTASALDSGGIDYVTINSSSGHFYKYNDTISSAILSGFKGSDHWILLTVHGKNKHTYKTQINFTVNLSSENNLGKTNDTPFSNPITIIIAIGALLGSISVVITVIYRKRTQRKIGKEIISEFTQ